MDKCFPCLKWTSLSICLGTAVLCLVLVGFSTINKKDSQTTRTYMAVLASIGIPVSILGVWGALRHLYFLFLAFWIYVSFNGLFALNIALKDSYFWFYPTICWTLWLPLSLYCEQLRQLRKRTKGLEPI